MEAVAGLLTLDLPIFFALKSCACATYGATVTIYSPDYAALSSVIGYSRVTWFVTAVMSRLIFTFCAFSPFSLPVTAQVKIIVPQQNQKKYETIHASLENGGSKPVTFCIEVGQTSPRGDGEIQATPSPFWVQRNSEGKWGTLMIGPEVGSLKSPQVLDPGKTMKFPFRLGDSGQMRLRLNYWNGSLPSLDCHAPPEGARRVTSAVFKVE